MYSVLSAAAAPAISALTTPICSEPKTADCIFFCFSLCFLVPFPLLFVALAPFRVTRGQIPGWNEPQIKVLSIFWTWPKLPRAAKKAYSGSQKTVFNFQSGFSFPVIFPPSLCKLLFVVHAGYGWHRSCSHCIEAVAIAASTASYLPVFGHLTAILTNLFQSLTTNYGQILFSSETLIDGFRAF